VSETFLRIKAVMRATGMSRAQVYRAMHDPALRFPNPVKIGRRGAAWVESEISKWQRQRIEARDAAHANRSSATASVRS
jgi:predicted DNA-binding transcriptional regulator AlpA